MKRRMLRITTLLVVFLGLYSCNDLSKPPVSFYDGWIYSDFVPMKGNVAEDTTIVFDYSERFGKPYLHDTLSIYIRKFDSKGNVVERKFYDNKGNVKETLVFEYDSLGRLQRKIDLNNDSLNYSYIVGTDTIKCFVSNTKQKELYYCDVFDKKGNIAQRVFSAYKDLINYKENKKKREYFNGDISFYSYNNANLVEKIESEGVGRPRAQFDYIFDKKGNWIICKIHYDNSNSHDYIERKIVYED